MNYPLVIFSFNRPQKLKQLLINLQGEIFQKVIIFCDGPRFEDEREQCEENQRQAQAFKFHFDTEIISHKHNYGLIKNFAEGLTRVFQQYEAAIILEDDCLPKLGFFKYVTQGLNIYQSRKDIFSIGAYHRPMQMSQKREVFLSPRFNCWGWATWQDRWQSIAQAVHSGISPFRHYYMIPQTAGIDIPMRARSAVLKKRPLTWDTLVALHCLKHQWYQLQPLHVMVNNIGFDGSGMNCPPKPDSDQGEDILSLSVPTEMPQDIQLYPEVIKANRLAYYDPKLTSFRLWHRKYIYLMKISCRALMPFK